MLACSIAFFKRSAKVVITLTPFLMIHMDIIQNFIQPQTAFTPWLQTELILFRVGFGHTLESVRLFFKVASETAEHTTGTITSACLQFSFFRDSTVFCHLLKFLHRNDCSIGHQADNIAINRRIRNIVLNQIFQNIPFRPK